MIPWEIDHRLPPSAQDPCHCFPCPGLSDASEIPPLLLGHQSYYYHPLNNQLSFTQMVVTVFVNSFLMYKNVFLLFIMYSNILTYLRMISTYHCYFYNDVSIVCTIL